MAKNRATERHRTVTWFEPRQCFKRRIGKRTFYLGSDVHAAEAEAAAIKSRWRRLRAEGKREWPEGEPNRLAIQDALGQGGFAPVALPPSGGAANPAGIVPEEEFVDPRAINVEQAANLYIEERTANPGKAGPRTLADLAQRLDKGITILGRGQLIARVRQAELIAFMGHWTKAIKRGASSPVYARNIASTVKGFLAWAADHQEIGWVKPPKFDAMLLVQLDKPRNDAEMEAFKARAWGEDKRHFSIEELRALYRAADPKMRAFMLLSLNTAFSPIEIGRLRTTDLRQDGETWIQTVRGKTLIKSKHVLWPETVAALQEAKAPANNGHYFFLSTAGKPFVGVTSKLIGGALWSALRKAAQRPKAPAFKFLRHTSGNAIEKIADQYVSEVHMAHARKAKMQEPYTERDWEKHALAVRELRKVFAPMWA